ncbi:TetR/AcrR family transcriptional regulator [Agrobacterium vitis]|uniref:TetR/AcrR family transcriptional regulator n=1 Tax=Rhizobium/Agrobacterium group TaxID=227290 RepID=UPI001F338071|nr:TetR/AcrR family transcriptional regulator C-terminal domain-containing protein [Allorhizobium ampelinum]MCF1485121.1 TetR/AcrR family transcriptional regulator [Allorhizobium ampelinum]
MKNLPKPAANGGAVLWERPEPKGPLAPLNREIITNGAIAIADRQGLASVSLRKVAASLDATTMRLYSYLSTKEELLELMVDAVYGEMLAAGPLGSGWREALRTVGDRLRQATRQHPWFIELLGGRPNLGPNAITHLEAVYAALSDAHAFKDMDAIMQAVNTVAAYVIGALRNEANELRAERESGMGPTEWQVAWWPYLKRLIATGRFPMMARVVSEATHPGTEIEFDRGLDCVLAGIELILLMERRS